MGEAVTLDRRKLVEEHFDLPAKLFHKRFRGTWVEAKLGKDDCISTGHLAMCLASRTWSGTGSFGHYATVAIQRRTLEAAAEEGTIRVPVHFKRTGQPHAVAAPFPDNFDAECKPSSPVSSEELDLILTLLDRLTPDERQWLTDHYLLGKTFRDMARDRGCTYAFVCKNFNAALDRARAIAVVLASCGD